MHDADLRFASARTLIDGYRNRRFSPVDVTRAMLGAIDALNPRLNCYCLVDHAFAMAQARASEARWMADAPIGPLDGVPASVKDLILTRGWPTLRGSRTVDPAGPWDTDAPSTARLREAGAVLLGKTTTPEFGWRGSTDSPLTGITRNPWNTDCTPGGSSGGATAAIAAGLCTVATGTDGGGSVRIPAAFTGTVGLKAHYGRIPAYPISPMGSVAHIGPQVRTVDDAALMLSVLAAPDARDWTALPPASTDWVAEAAKGVAGLRIAYSPRLGHVRWVDPRIEAALARAAEVFVSLGAVVEQVDPDIGDSADVFGVHWFSSARQFLHRLPAEQHALLDPGLRAVIERAARFRLVDFLDAQAARAAMAIRMAAFGQRYDLLLTPATAVLPFGVGRVMPDPPPQVSVDDPNDWTWWTPFSYPFNLTQQPAIVVGAGFAEDGLPIALQLVAPNYREDLCLRGAAAYEYATGWCQRRPPI